MSQIIETKILPLIWEVVMFKILQTFSGRFVSSTVTSLLTRQDVINDLSRVILVPGCRTRRNRYHVFHFTDIYEKIDTVLEKYRSLLV